MNKKENILKGITTEDLIKELESRKGKEVLFKEKHNCRYCNSTIAKKFTYNYGSHEETFYICKSCAFKFAW